MALKDTRQNTGGGIKDPIQFGQGSLLEMERLLIITRNGLASGARPRFPGRGTAPPLELLTRVRVRHDIPPAKTLQRLNGTPRTCTEVVFMFSASIFPTLKTTVLDSLNWRSYFSKVKTVPRDLGHILGQAPPKFAFLHDSNVQIGTVHTSTFARGNSLEGGTPISKEFWVTL